ncbi:MAG: hypothetical protein Q8L36_00510 [bacterium]|nr:hypothetical protein [bacterium]
MSKKYIIWAVLVAAIIVVTFFVVSAFVKTASESVENQTVVENDLNTSSSAESDISSGTVSAETEAGLVQGNLTVAVAEHRIIYSNNAFEPANLIIKKGDKVTFYNISGDFVWPASALHPTHKNYPDSDIKKCGTADEEKIFDACRKLSPGEDWSFIFNEIGSWPYHNHLQASENGVIIVEN